MMSLFSSFDFIWMIFPKFFELLVLFILISKFFSISIFSFVWIKVKSLLFSFFSSLNSLGYSKMSLLFLWSLSILIFFLNFSSIFPFVFSYSAQVSVVLFLSMSFWTGFMFYYNFTNFKNFISHSVPEGSPMALVPVLFLIEIVSNIIRPVTLTVRLVANILAGHLLLILLSKIVFAQTLSYPFFFALNTVELFVGLIQSYIFVTMVSLYYSDIS